MAKPERQLAIIQEPHLGVRDYGKTALWFVVELTENHTGALQVFHDPIEVFCLIEAYGVRDIKDLKGKSCWVDVTLGRIVWVGPITKS